jgi:hypothetical protein
MMSEMSEMSEMIQSCVDEARREFERVIEQRVCSMLRDHIMGTGTDAFDLLKDAIHNIEDAFSQLHELTVDADSMNETVDRIDEIILTTEYSVMTAIEHLAAILAHNPWTSQRIKDALEASLGYEAVFATLRYRLFDVLVMKTLNLN